MYVRLYFNSEFSSNLHTHLLIYLRKTHIHTGALSDGKFSFSYIDDGRIFSVNVQHIGLHPVYIRFPLRLNRHFILYFW